MRNWRLYRLIFVALVLVTRPHSRGVMAVPGAADCTGSADVVAVVSALFADAPCPEADVNDDGAVTAADVVAIVRQLAAPSPTGSPRASRTPTRTRTPTRSATGVRTPSPTPSSLATRTPTAPPTDTPGPAVTATPVLTATERPPTPTLSPTNVATPIVTGAPTRTPASDVGPVVTFFGAANTEGCIACPSVPGCLCPGATPTPVFKDGLRVYQAAQSGVVMLVVEGMRGSSNSEPGTALVEPLPAGRPDLQIEASLPLGNGNAAVLCPGQPGAPDDGIPRVEPPDFGPGDGVTNALRDLACRFEAFDVNYPCTLDADGSYNAANPASTVQFCGVQMLYGQTVPEGDTVFTVRLRDRNLNLGPAEQIIVRRQR